MSKAPLSFRALSPLLFFLALVVVSNEGFYHVAAFNAPRGRGSSIYSWSPSFVFDLYFDPLPGQEQPQTSSRDHPNNGFHDGIGILENIAILTLVEFLCIVSLPILWSFWKVKEISGTLLLSLQSQIFCMPSTKKEEIVSSPSTPTNL